MLASAASNCSFRICSPALIVRSVAAITRRDNLKRLLEQRFGGRIADLGRAIERDDAYVWQLLHGKRNIGERVARDIELKLDQWKRDEPKEFANRGKNPESQLRKEIANLVAVWGKGEIRVVDPGSHPRYEPHKWNDNSAIQNSTNCYAYACDDEVLETFQLVSRLEGIIPALESTHAVVHGLKRAREMRKDQLLLINLSGRGDKDVAHVARLEGRGSLL